MKKNPWIELMVSAANEGGVFEITRKVRDGEYDLVFCTLTVGDKVADCLARVERTTGTYELRVLVELKKLVNFFDEMDGLVG
ncbi:hypothetical protein AV944_06625 [Sphingomonas sp. LK11]|jgi:hypothetical protein|uniref:hypothetical protein n=1 Tax=Sphingomonas sp. LK11 TaxID=1390395 RepID=UPI0009728F77|nr:hypothetical protein [Sphingomonas sp. LK11]APX65571.1 hypothetical protein AV944_06625 [Sphingomonas sp. LK11]